VLAAATGRGSHPCTVDLVEVLPPFSSAGERDDLLGHGRCPVGEDGPGVGDEALAVLAECDEELCAEDECDADPYLSSAAPKVAFRV